MTGYVAPVTATAVTAAPAPATVIVQLPVDATLSIDGQAVKQDRGVSKVQTPELQSDRQYYYTLKVEAVRDGKVVSATKKVDLRAGRETRVDFPEWSPVATASR